MRITSIRANFKKLNDSIKEYISQGKADEAFLIKLRELDKEGAFKSLPETWSLIFSKYHYAKNFYPCRFEVAKHQDAYIEFLKGLNITDQEKSINAAEQYVQSWDSKMLDFIYAIIDNNEKNDLHGVCGRLVDKYDLAKVVKIWPKLGRQNCFLTDRFETDFNKLNFSSEPQWMSPIIGNVVSEKMRIRILKKAIKEIGAKAENFIEPLKINVDSLKAELTEDLLRSNDIETITRNFSLKLHDKEVVVAHVAKIIEKKQNPGPEEIAKEMLGLTSHRSHPLFHPLMFAVDRWRY